MQIHTEHTKNKSQAILCQTSVANYRSEVKKLMLPEFKLGDFFVTLTFNDALRFHEVRSISRLKLFTQKINRAVYGKLYDLNIKTLNLFAVFEHNLSNGLHIHLLIQKPEPNSRFRGDFATLLKTTWVSMNWEIATCAQDVKPITHNLGHVIDYMTKQIKKPDDMLKVVININNTKL